MSDMPQRLADALRTVDDFTAVQRCADPGTMVDAVLRLQGCVGIDEEVRVTLREGLERLGRSDDAGAILLGLILGLWTAGEGPIGRVAVEAGP